MVLHRCGHEDVLSITIAPTRPSTHVELAMYILFKYELVPIINKLMIFFSVQIRDFFLRTN